MKTRKEYVVEVMKELEKLTNKYGYRALEVAFLIDENGQKNYDEITDEQVNTINDYIEPLSMIVDEGVQYEVDEILNGSEE